VIRRKFVGAQDCPALKFAPISRACRTIFQANKLLFIWKICVKQLRKNSLGEKILPAVVRARLQLCPDILSGPNDFFRSLESLHFLRYIYLLQHPKQPP